jgi:hypothetical protein
MIRTLPILFFLVAQSTIAAGAATCAGPNPAITRVAVQSVTSGPVNQYHLVGTVVNFGSEHQSPNALQFVDIYQYGIKLDAKAIPPLGRLQSATFSYMWPRNPEAAKGTTTLNFRIRMVQGTDCNPANGTYSLTF